MKKKVLTLLALALTTTSLMAQDQKYKVTIDLNNVVEDRVMVTCELPAIPKDTIEYHIPKIVPGTYSIYDFGRFALDFKAMNADGDTLTTTNITDNRIAIYGSKDLASISYWVDDTYDTDKSNFIFEPAGTSIEDDTCYVINTFAMVGYLEGMKDLPYEVTISKPAALFGATALSKEIINDSTDVYTTGNYFDLADGPIMYSVPDTATFEVGGAKILISVYSPNNVLESSFVKEQIVPTLEAQKEYMGGELPVDNYAFLVYLFNGMSGSGGFGALEHSYSSMYSLPELDPMRLAQIIRDVAAHEFFHIVTPLNIHSEEIGEFDFINPKMSKHLWLYEGMTEYAAGLAQVKYGEMSMDDYLNVIFGKIKSSRSNYQDDLPFTELSKKCLDETKDQYGNVYQKGALIGMALDIRLRELSGGEYGVEQMMIDLSKKYGKEQSFKDDELFDQITEMTYPEIGEFFDQYVAGGTPIPYGDFLGKAGIDFDSGESTKELSLGQIGFAVHDTLLMIQSVSKANAFGREMGYQQGDIFLEFDGEDIDISNYQELFAAYKENHEVGDKIKIIVLRENEDGELKKVKLKARAIEVEVTKDSKISLNPDATEEQLALRKAWLNK
ncbi:M61 family metallopeptidase [Reichenbachiella ulvae]|uniref:Peptidase M61 n=1 Tax=Reichenbachiella ulvae TaxID=2980104 RepID=A0ABT3CZ97_9BACT|nr:peptidase M61 [Reichenbachiella ulvae]MCV9388891.1 peptidase M61 [Reichenbachiella ulvae]